MVSLFIQTIDVRHDYLVVSCGLQLYHYSDVSAVTHLLCSRVCHLSLQMKRNLYNFSLLFASNVENLLAFMVQGLISEGLLHFIEVCLGMVYLAAVLYNLYWFLTPLAEREEFDAMSRWIEDRVDHVVDVTMKPFRRLKTKAVHWLREIGIAEGEPPVPRRPSVLWRRGVMAAVFTREKNGEGETKDDGARTSLGRDEPFNEDRKKM